MPRGKPTGELYICTQTFMLNDGSMTVVHKGDLARAGTAVLEQYPANFILKPEPLVRFELEPVKVGA